MVDLASRRCFTSLYIFATQRTCTFVTSSHFWLKWSVYLMFQVDKQWQGYSWPAYVAGTLGIVYAVIGKHWQNLRRGSLRTFSNFSRSERKWLPGGRLAPCCVPPVWNCWGLPTKFSFLHLASLVSSIVSGWGHNLCHSFLAIITPLCRPAANGYLGLELWGLPQVNLQKKAILSDVTLSLSALAQDTNSVFSCGASVAPVVR